jgi:hypothetical protein
MTEAEMRDIILAFPGAEEGTSYGHPAFKVRGKFFTRLRAEDGSVVLSDVGFDEREMLMAAEPATFHLTPHYQNYPTVLARIESLDPGSLRNLLECRWRKLVTKAMAKAYEAAQTQP